LALAILIAAGAATPCYSPWFGTAGVLVAGGKFTPAPDRLKKHYDSRLSFSAAISPERRFLCALPCLV